MYPAIKKVVANEDHTLTLDFDNGEKGRLDLKPYLDFGVFRQLKDLQAFKQVRIAFDTVEWATGVDLDPEFVYEKSQKS
mgnify:CR=1 FL=1